VHHQAHPDELAWWWLTQHNGQGLDNSIEHVKLVFQTLNAIPKNEKLLWKRQKLVAVAQRGI
jgi:hypothetical protein